MSQGIDVNEDSNMAEIGQAKLINGAMVTQAEVAESSVMVEARQFQGEGKFSRYTNVEAELGSNPSSSLKPEGANRAGVYADLALDAAGIGAVGQMGKMLTDVIKDTGNPLMGKNAVHIDDILSGKVSKKKSINQPFNEKASLKDRAVISSTFSQGEDKVKGAKMSEQKYAEFSKRRELSLTSKMVNKQKLEMANAAELKVGAKVAKAKQMGIAPGQLALDKMKPKAPNFEEKPIEDDTTAWA